MKKRVIHISVVLAILIIFVISDKAVRKYPNTIAMYEGKWKVTKFLAEYFRNRSTFYSHHYLGRTVILGDKSVEQSILEWPHYLDWTKEEYDSSEVVWFPRDDTWVWVNFSWEIDEFVESEEIQFIRYLKKGTDESVYCVNYFIVLDNTHLVYSSPGGYYLLEPFQHCDPKVNAGALSGNWDVAYLDSYENSYVGSFEEIKELKEHIYPNLKEKWDELKGTDFAVEEWLGKTVYISEDTLILSELSFQIREVEESRVLREDFEKEMEIHDGLSIYDDEINICNIKCSNGEEIICVLVDTNRIIMHIEQGWFMLNRK